MALETHGGRTYYYRAKRVGDRVVKEYVASGDVATVFLHQDRLARWRTIVQRSDDKVDIADSEQERRALRDECRRIAGATGVYMVLAGYHQHKGGEWRKMRKETKMKQIESMAPIPATDRERREAIQRAIDNPTDAEARHVAALVTESHPECRPMLMGSSLYPAMRQRIGNDPTGSREIVLKANVENMRAALSGDNPSPLEAMLIENILACWVFRGTCQETVSQGGTASTQIRSHRVKRMESANRMYLASVKTLAEVRKLQIPDIIAVQFNLTGEKAERALKIVNGE